MLDGFKRAAFVFCDLLRFFLGGGWLCCEVAIFLMLRCLVGLNIRRFCDVAIAGCPVEAGKGQDLIIPAIVSIREARLPRKRTLS